MNKKNKLSEQSIQGKKFSLSSPESEAQTIKRLELQVKALKTENSELRFSLHEDDLTGLLNARALRVNLEETLQTQKAEGAPMALLFIDVDRFKEVNEQHGHLAAGRVLEQIGRLIGRVIRTHDLAFRYGGDEFVVLVSGGAFGARLVGERIRKSIEGHVFRANGLKGPAEIRSTVSIGARVLGPDDTVESLLESADRAMFEAKRNSRNSFVAA